MRILVVKNLEKRNQLYSAIFFRTSPFVSKGLQIRGIVFGVIALTAVLDVYGAIIHFTSVWQIAIPILSVLLVALQLSIPQVGHIVPPLCMLSPLVPTVSLSNNFLSYYNLVLLVVDRKYLLFAVYEIGYLLLDNYTKPYKSEHFVLFFTEAMVLIGFGIATGRVKTKIENAEAENRAAVERYRDASFEYIHENALADLAKIRIVCFEVLKAADTPGDLVEALRRIDALASQSSYSLRSLKFGLGTGEDCTLRDLLEMQRQSLAAGGIELRVETESVDEELLRISSEVQAVLNECFNNVYKFCPPSSVCECSLTVSGKTLFFSITNPLEVGKQRILGGGYGLPHISAICRSHGGELHVESIDGRWNVFGRIDVTG